MTRLEVGKVYKPIRVRKSETQVGKWELFVVEDERGNSPIAVFATNMPTGIEEGESFRIKSIQTVASKNRVNSNGNWVTDTSINAEIEKVISYDEFKESDIG